MLLYLNLWDVCWQWWTQDFSKKHSTEHNVLISLVHHVNSELRYNASTIWLSSRFEWHVGRIVYFRSSVTLTVESRRSQWILDTCSCCWDDGRWDVGLWRNGVWPGRICCSSKWWRWCRWTFLQLGNVALDSLQEWPITRTTNRHRFTTVLKFVIYLELLSIN